MVAKKTPRMSAHFRRAPNRDAEVQYLHDAIEQLRHYHKGMEARDGFSLQRRKIVRMSKARIERVKRLAADLRRTLASPAKVIRPRSAKSRAALERYTGVKPDRSRKAFVVHVRRPETTKVKVRRAKKKSAPATVEEVETVDGMRQYQRYYMFSQYSKRRPVTMDAVLSLATRMLQHMPQGRYVMVSSEHGYIGTAMNRDRLLRAIEDDWMMYDRMPGQGGLAGTLIGFTLIATTEEGSRREYTERMSRRDEMAAARKRAQSKRRTRLAKRRGR